MHQVVSKFEGFKVAGTFLPTKLDAQEQLNIVRDANQARLAAKPVKLIERVSL